MKYKLYQDGPNSFSIKRLQRLSSGWAHVMVARGLSKGQAESLLSQMEAQYGQKAK